MSEQTTTTDQEFTGADQEFSATNTTGQTHPDSQAHQANAIPGRELETSNGNQADTKPDLTQCENTSEKGRRCKLSPGHDGPHRYVLRDQVKRPPTLAELRKQNRGNKFKFSLVAEDIPTDADVSRQYTGREIERDEDQLEIDKSAKSAYDKWVKGGQVKGKFEELAPKFGSRFIVPPEAFDTMIEMLRRSTQRGAATNGKQLAYRRGQHKSGNVIINFMIVDHGTFPKGSATEGTDNSEEPNGNSN